MVEDITQRHTPTDCQLKTKMKREINNHKLGEFDTIYTSFIHKS